MSGRFEYGFFSRSTRRWVTAATTLLSIVVLGLGVGAPAEAFEAFDGRFQAHGFFESQMRVMSADYAEDWDMAQWYQVFNLEVELDILPDGIGPIDMLSGYVRAEVRYDCVYSRGCGMFRGVNAYGDRSKSLPRRLSNARQRTAMGTIARDSNADGDPTDFSRRSGGTTDPVPLSLVSGFSTLAGSAGADQAIGNPTDSPDCQNDFVDTATNTNLVGLERTTCASLVGGDLGIAVFGTQGTQAKNDDPFEYVFERFSDFRFTQIQGRGGSQYGLPTRAFGPWLPKNFINENAGLADRINPFDRTETSPVVAAATFNTAFVGEFNRLIGARGLDPDDPADTGAIEVARQDAQSFANFQATQVTGSGANPFRPIPIKAPGDFGRGNDIARGMYLPSEGLRNNIDDFDNPQFNFRESERAWNRGASQQDEKELKEAYLDVELFDSRLWLRIGKQSIVWGKTELFRTTDQFNPQDLALASLPSLEESRIALWAFRGVYSFYEVGPFSDVRLEAAFNFDDFEPADLGACGEAYTPNLVCELTFGMFAHGTAGLGIAGVERPDDPWSDLSAWEFGGRLEFRWERLSFAITNFYGYNDTPTLKRISTYERNVDPGTGRPRAFGRRGTCRYSRGDWQGRDANAGDCLQPGPTSRTKQVLLQVTGEAGDPANGVPPGFVDKGDELGRQLQNDPNNALDHHHVNQQIFAMICSTTIGFSGLDRRACAQTVFGSTADPTGTGIFIAQAIGATVRGSDSANTILSGLLTSGVKLPLVLLNSVANDPQDLGNGNTNCKASYFAFGTTPVFIPIDPTEDQRPRCGGNDPSELTPGVHGNFAVAGEALAQGLSPEQEALLGCGPFWGTNCDDDGFDLMNMELSSVMQSFTGVEGTNTGWRTDGKVGQYNGVIQNTDGLAFSDVNGDGVFDQAAGDRLRQPGTVGFLGATPCTFGDLLVPGRKGSETARLPGCRSPYTDSDWDPKEDGDPRLAQLSLPLAEGPSFLVASPGTHPFTGQDWENEMAIVSWNFQALLVANSGELTADLEKIDAKAGLTPAEKQAKKIKRAYSVKNGKCSFRQPQFCGTPEALFAIAGVTRPTVEAGGSGRFGRRTFTWHSGGEAVLVYERRNVLGFSADFAEDVTKSNWSMEFTWFDDISRGDADQRDGNSTVDTFNLTISVDRPTFINFLNANRTFFFNSQWFFQYTDGYRSSFGGNGPFNILGTFAVSTGYYQDRLLPSLVFVYDVQSVSGAALPQVTYRYNEAFSVTVGAAMFMGRTQLKDRPVNPLGGVGNLQGPNRDKVGVENGLAVVRDRDEVFVRIRYTF
ncbi:MAG: DUF1302 family protein [Myxococcota bacterium]